MKIEQTLNFKRVYKRLYNNQKNIVDDEIRKVCEDPTIGTEKKQDLSGVYVHKFVALDKQFLLAYTYDPQTLKLILLGVHENFSRDLKKSMK